MANKIPFPSHLLNYTPATIRVAFDSTPPVITENGIPGGINITSILSTLLQTVGRFAERWNSDALYGIDHIRELCENEYPLEHEIDEIFVFGVRADGVDHASYVMQNLYQSRRPMMDYVFPTPYYRAILAVNVRVYDDEETGRTHVLCQLKNLTHEIHRIDESDLDENGKLLPAPYADGNPVPSKPVEPKFRTGKANPPGQLVRVRHTDSDEPDALVYCHVMTAAEFDVDAVKDAAARAAAPDDTFDVHKFMTILAETARVRCELVPSALEVLVP